MERSAKEFVADHRRYLDRWKGELATARAASDKITSKVFQSWINEAENLVNGLERH